MMDKTAKKIVYLSEFVEQPDKKLFGFTITFETGEIRNHFIIANQFQQSDIIEDLRKMYKKIKKNNKSKEGQNV
ncbi:MAG: hypothetical protein U9N34_01660 [Candidatus Cloacimonadota bacterium]|nr:hypothetical protein [Candidatus Cloacimonadota bacterium]